MAEAETPVGPDHFPTAIVVGGKQVRAVQSRIWFATGACAIIAAALVWMQVHAVGPEIKIFFAQGHGLEPGDPVRYRGIVVGEVRRVLLQEDLEEVVVVVELEGQAAELAREGTRFWIERPEVRIGQVRGLDTLLGGHYVGVAPGPADAPAADEFHGLNTAPESIESLANGLEVVLEGKHRMGLQAGSPVNYRGIQIGAIQSVGLANDSTTVLARALIQPQYRRLVCQASRFWSTSGIDLRFGFQGLELDADTLTTIAAGGVALATPDDPGEPVATGHRFELFESARSDWSSWQPRIAIGGLSLPPDARTPAPLLAIRRAPRGPFGVFGDGQRRGWLLMLSGGRLVGPAGLLAADAESESVLEVSGYELTLESAEVTVDGLLAMRTVPRGFDGADAWPIGRVRTAEKPEEIVLTCGSDDKTLPLPIERLSAIDHGWILDSSVPVDKTWEGACAVGVADGFLVGLLVAEDGQMVISPIGKRLLEVP